MDDFKSRPHFSKLGDEYILRGPAGTLPQGQVVEISTRSGKTQRVRVGELIEERDGQVLHRVDRQRSGNEKTSNDIADIFTRLERLERHVFATANAVARVAPGSTDDELPF